MSSAAPALKVLRRADYAPVPWTTTAVDLDFSIREGATRVTAVLSFARNARQPADGPVALHRGHDVALAGIALDSAPLEGYALDDKFLTFAVPAAAAAAGKFELRIVTDIVPEANTRLEGLYRSTGTYCTQCEAEGFRSITFFQDRPDVMAKWSVRIEADEAACPVLLSNGNLTASSRPRPGATGRPTWTRSQSRATCSRSSRATWPRRRIRSRRPRGAASRCASTRPRATPTRLAGPWRRCSAQ
jgi:aminopeptidase N